MSFKSTALTTMDKLNLTLASGVFTEDGRGRRSNSGIWCYTWSHTYLHCSFFPEQNIFFNPTVMDLN